MNTITTEYGDIRVHEDTDEATIAILKTATPFFFAEFVHTGNSSSGKNSGNYEEFIAWLESAGIPIQKGDDEPIIDDLLRGQVTGIWHFQHRGVKLVYHVQRRQGADRGDFGYTWRVEFRIVSCGPAE